VLHTETVQGKIVLDALRWQRETLQEKVTQETQWLKFESTEHARKGLAKQGHVNVHKHQRTATKTCADSLALHEGFTRFECPPVSSYSTTIKSSIGYKILRTGW
jgi:hypothetical protein